MKLRKTHLVVALLIGTFVMNVPIFAAIAWTTTGTNTWSDGPVGIGTSSPASTLDINGTVLAGNSTANFSGFKSRAPSGKWGFNQADIMVVGVGGNLYSKGFSSNAMGIFNGTTTFQDMFLYNKNGADAGYLVLKSNNRVGINTAAPAGVLDVAGSGTTTNIVASTVDSASWVQLKSNTDGSKYMFGNAGNRFEIGTYDGTNGVTNWDVFKIIRNGNIEMGSNSNPVNLAVNGLIKTKEIQVTNNNWADYVFEKDYVLKPISEVKAFINKNKHLPDVPSKKIVEENGINVGDMQRIQMQKIEELTLYVIQLEERLNKLEGK
jgi:hypothetical protein